jgi:tetratricopeptide (TPR) repeat protein
MSGSSTERDRMEQHDTRVQDAPLGQDARRTLIGLLAGCLLAVFALQLVPFDPTDELPSVAGLPDMNLELAGLREGKAEDEFRIFTIGASLSQGFPYEPIYSAAYGKLLGDGLAALATRKRIVARTIARPALDSPRLVEIVEHVCDAKPDVIVVTLGSNEYANRLFSSTRLVPIKPVPWVSERVGRARVLWSKLPGDSVVWPKPGEGDPRAEVELSKKLVARVWHARPGEPQLGALPFVQSERRMLNARLEKSMRRIDALAREAGAELVFCHMVYGLGKFWPWGNDSSGPDAEIDALALRFHLGQGEGVTLADVDGLLAQAPERADLVFMRGLVLRRAGQAEAARVAFERARDLDPVPLHRTAAIYETVTNAAKALGRPLLDLDAPFEELSPDGIPGDEHYLDYGHLSASGHRIAAGYVARELHARGLLPLAGSFDAAAFDAAAQQAISRDVEPLSFVSAPARMNAANGNYGLLFGNFRDAMPYLREAFRELPQDAENASRLIFCLSHLANRQAEFGKGERANKHFQKLYQEMLEALAEQRLDTWIGEYLRG